MDIHHSYLKDFKTPKVKSVLVIDYYGGIDSILKLRDEFPYEYFFANPRLRTHTEITWATDAFIQPPQLLSELEEPLKEHYAYALTERILALESLIKTLREEDGGEMHAELLSRAISYIDDRSVYCGDGNIVVVNWGLIPRTSDITAGKIYRSGGFVNNWNQQYSIHKESDKDSVEEQDIVAEEEKQVLYVPVDEPPVQEVEEKPTEPITVITEPVSDIVHIVNEVETEASDEVAEQNTQEDDKREESKPDVDVTHEDEHESTDEDKKEEQKINEAVQHEESKSDDEYSWRKLLSEIGKGLKFLFGKLRWPLLVALLLLLALLLSKNCQGPISLVNPFYSPLPKNPVILPVYEDKVGLSEDGMVQIATDRLTILLEKHGDDTMLEWAKAFKKAYSSADYEIYYYDEELYILQIKVPEDKREQVKAEINDKLKDFDFEVLDEVIYQSNAPSFNDPELKKKQCSWYLDAINVFEAWSVTLGNPDVVVAVVDNGFDLTHPEFKGKVYRPYNALTGKRDIWPIRTDDGVNAHGTHVAATSIGNCNNGTGLMGVAPNCKFMPVQVGKDTPNGHMDRLAIIAGIQYAINNGADVINLSLGLAVSDELKAMPENQQLNYINQQGLMEEGMWNKIYKKASDSNVIIVNSAGNDNMVAGIDPQKRSNKTIRVSALDKSLQKADFSNFGRYKDLDKEYSTLSAPGVNIYSAAPNGQYMYMQGTSMAAPIVTGAVALLKSVNRSINTAQAVKLLKETGREVNPTIGPMINVGLAVKRAFGGGSKKATDCDAIRKQIERLTARIDSLKQLCPESATPRDTLKFKDAVKDNRGLDGLWKTTTYLISSIEHTPIELYMQFKNLSGTLTLKHQGNVFTAPLKAKIAGGGITITQLDDARSSNASVNYHFLKYIYSCSSDRKGNLSCKATNSSGTVVFNLIRME